MSRIAFVTWNGGGNLTPALAIVRELHRSGHRAAFLGQEAQRPPWRPGWSRRPRSSQPPLITPFAKGA